MSLALHRQKIKSITNYSLYILIKRQNLYIEYNFFIDSLYDPLCKTDSRASLTLCAILCPRAFLSSCKFIFVQFCIRVIYSPRAFLSSCSLDPARSEIYALWLTDFVTFNIFNIQH